MNTTDISQTTTEDLILLLKRARVLHLWNLGRLVFDELCNR